MRLIDLFSIHAHAEATHRWAEAHLLAANRSAAAFKVALHIADIRTGGAPQYFEAWKLRYDGGVPHDPALRDSLVAFLGSESIGTPGNPAPDAHVEGFVAEHIWHMLTVENAIGFAEPLRVEEPTWSVTDSGGDGLAIYRVDGALAFRLWESKAHAGVEGVRDVVNLACRQLDASALKYLARFSKVGQMLPDAEVARFYGQMSELWRQRSPQAGGGVSVSTGATSVADCFGNFPSYWKFVGQDQRHGIVVVIENFADFAKQVRAHLWKGL